MADLILDEYKLEALRLALDISKAYAAEATASGELSTEDAETLELVSSDWDELAEFFARLEDETGHTLQ